MIMEALLSQWEEKVKGNYVATRFVEQCKRCKKYQPLIFFYDNHHRRKLCKECRDYNRVYCRKYFADLKKIEKLEK